MAEQKPGWKHLPEGDILAAGTAEKFKTGDWRSTKKPIYKKETCINCYFCWVNCPDCSITLDADKKVSGIDYEHCKGCGICAEVCPTKPKSIEMVKEDK
jgi:pyruvate ferredoxin oxidoreductase delta subunit